MLICLYISDLNLLYINHFIIKFKYIFEKYCIICGENFDKCAMNHSFGLFFSVMLSFNFFIIISNLLLLIFIEWNMEDFINDLRLLVSTLYIDILLIILQLIIGKTIKSYKFFYNK